MSRKMYTKEEVQKRLDTLPSEIKNLLYSIEADTIIQQVAVKNKLHIDQTAMLMAETNQIMCGFEEPSQFVPNLIETLQIDKAKADAVAKDINDLLFSKIRDAMKKTDTALPTEPSVVMPSAVKSAPSVAPSSPTPPAPTPKPAPPASPVTPVMPAVHAADIMLSEPTISMPPKPAVPAPAVTAVPAQTPAASPAAPETAAKVEPPKPAPSYKADPYREPPE